MRVTGRVREEVRRRAGFACEYCGVSETDAAGQLTVDHFQPQAKGGSDALDNLIYCCHRCNEYKSDYWPGGPADVPSWNPRQDAAATHFLELADGVLYGVTPTGVFTLDLLRLNRPQLVAHRLRRRQSAEEQRLLGRLQAAVSSIEQLQAQYAALLEDNRAVLEEQRRVLRILAGELTSGGDGHET